MKNNIKLLLTFLLFSSNAIANSIDNVKALEMALDDEQKAKATYLQVINDFGEVRPFSNILQSEQRHINALMPFFAKYGVAPKQNPYLGNTPSFGSIKEACEAGVDAEVENVNLYHKIFALTDDKDLIRVFENLQWASEQRHLRAFQRCAARN